MMKKYLVISMMGITLTSGHLVAKPRETVQDKLISAIEQSDVALVKRLLRRAGDIDGKDKKELIEAGSEAVDLREQSSTLLKSPWDLAKLATGVPLSLVGVLGSGLGIFGVLEGLEESNMKTCQMAGVVGVPGVIALATGLYLIVKGWKCSAAANRRNDAEKIEELLESIVIEKEKIVSII